MTRTSATRNGRPSATTAGSSLTLSSLAEDDEDTLLDAQDGWQASDGTGAVTNDTPTGDDTPTNTTN